MVTWLDLLWQTIIVAIIVFTILIIYRILMYVVRSGAKKQRIPLEATNGIKIILRLITIFLIIIALITFIPGASSYLLSISSITGVIIGFASTQVVSQFVAGIYLLSSRPFRVNDLVNINGIDGLILEIGLNFTTLQKFSGTIVKIPNKTILDAEVLKYTVKLTPEILNSIGSPIKKKKQLLETNEKTMAKKTKIKKDISKKLKLNDLKGIILENEIIRYTFEIAVDLDRLPEKTIEAVNTICNKHKNIYQYRPQFIVSYIYWRVHFRFKIYCNNPLIIIRNHSHFIKDLMIAIYGGG
ncbi:MAG: mechanosensitive ion channel [Candidatus Lokiarchaeia archaeon]|nr:mechanosensitive ion channel [Candidatus Lokiarchaeia archaeon]